METSAGQGEHGTGKSVKGSIRKIPSESVIRLWRNFLRQCLIRGLEVDFCSLPFRKKLYRRSIKNPNPFPIWKIWFGLYAFGAGGGGRTRTNFNPLPSCEGRPYIQPRLPTVIKISIHSPHTREDFFPHCLQCAYCTNFNPLPSCEGRRAGRSGSEHI